MHIAVTHAVNLLKWQHFCDIRISPHSDKYVMEKERVGQW